MVYRSPLRSNSSFQNHPSLHIFSAEYLSPTEWSVGLKSSLSTQNFPLDGKYKEIILYEDWNYSLTFSLRYYSEENNQVFIISPLGTIYQIFPQSNIKIDVDWEKLIVEAIEGKFIKYHSDTPSDNRLIKGFQQQIKYFEKKDKLEKIPNYIIQNPKITRISRDFTSFLSRFFPLIYWRNLDYYNTYEPFLELEEKNILETTPFLKQEIKNNREIVIQQINIKKYLKKLFTNF